jgi:hypothetical protein
MPSISTIYRQNNPEYAQKEKEYVINYIKNKYANDPEYREKMKKQSLARYYKKKEQNSLGITV